MANNSAKIDPLKINMNRVYNLNDNHPIIPNAQEYMLYKKYISIHSEDRDVVKFPNSSQFEIELPEDLLNVAALRLVNWSFPANYNTFSPYNNNVTMTFKITNPYNPGEHGLTVELYNRIFEALFFMQSDNFVVQIAEGFYNPQQMVAELTNKFNFVVTVKINAYFKQKALVDPSYLNTIIDFNSIGGYTNFVITYNNVSQKIWFGNNADGFSLTNETQLVKNEIFDDLQCNKKALPDYSDWGLPGYLGLTRCTTNSFASSTLNETNPNYGIYNGVPVPRFYYLDENSGNNGFWLTPNHMLPGSEVNWIECYYKINLMGDAYIYMEIEGQNCIDETSPFNISKTTSTTNITNGVVNASFAKMAVPTTPMSQWFDRDQLPYKFYYPPAERMRRFRFKLRYHNGKLVNFGNFNFSFVLEFFIVLPQILRNTTTIGYPVG